MSRCYPRRRADRIERGTAMPLARAEVYEFVADPKRVFAVPSDRMPGMAWTRASADRVLWRAPVERKGALARGNSLVLTATVALARDWTYTLRYRDEDVLRWDFTEPPCRHPNIKRLCPRDEFPPKVTCLEHEHRYVEGGDLKCAVPLDGMADLTHEEGLRAFCQRTNIVFDSAYRPPAIGEQLRIF